MKIVVNTVDSFYEYTDAAAWHVDADHGLHLNAKDKSPVASFAPGKWVAVSAER